MLWTVSTIKSTYVDTLQTGDDNTFPDTNLASSETENSEWKTFINIDSSFYDFWEFIISCSFWYFLYVLTYYSATYEIDLYIMLEKQGLSYHAQFFCLASIADVFYNCIV